VVIVAVWAASQLATILVPGYEPPDAIHAALMIVLGTVYALRDKDKGTDEDEDDDDPPEPEPEKPLPPGAVPIAELLARLAAESRRRDG
jgi:hypothetical protein